MAVCVERRKMSSSGLEVAALLFCLTCTVMCQDGCEAPDPVTNGYYMPQQIQYEYNSVVTYHCDSGYTLSDDSIYSRFCGGIRFINSYTWTGNTPACVPIMCPAPSIPDARTGVPETPAPYSSSFSYRCEEGLVPLGEQTAECTANATWHYTPCQTPEFTCDRNAIPTVSYATHNASALAHHPSGTIVRYTCSDGYRKSVAGDIKCVGTTWKGSRPSCTAEPISEIPLLGKGQTNPGTQNFVRIELPIVAGIGTALILTTALLITVYCLRRRKQSQYSQKADSMVSGTTNSSGPTDIVITPNQSFRLPRHQATTTTTTNYPEFHHQHSLRSQALPTISSPPALPLTQPPSSTLPRSGASSTDNTASEAEFHTIRECLGDFRNNNNSPVPVHTPSCPKLNNQQHPQHASYPYIRTAGHNTRPMWTPPNQLHHTCGRTTPYETVTCPHGVEHVYQHLEHVYEEPRHIWMHPLPNPQNQ